MLISESNKAFNSSKTINNEKNSIYPKLDSNSKTPRYNVKISKSTR